MSKEETKNKFRVAAEPEKSDADGIGNNHHNVKVAGEVRTRADMY
jgi:hypothetical protein